MAGVSEALGTKQTQSLRDSDAGTFGPVGPRWHCLATDSCCSEIYLSKSLDTDLNFNILEWPELTKCVLQNWSGETSFAGLMT